MKDFGKRLIQIPALAILVIAAGTAGYIVIERWEFLDAIYMTIITLSTVGFRETRTLSERGMVFTMFLILGGVGTMLYALAAGASAIMEGKLRQVFGRRKLEKKIQELKGHYIICGYGRMGKIIAQELQGEKVPFVVIEKDLDTPGENGDILMLQGDATRDNVLKDAGIEKAKGLISVLPSDAENLLVVLSARGLSPGLLIVVRAAEEDSEKKFFRAGATKVVSPYHIGGLRMAHTVLKPTVVDFIEFATRSGNIELQMQEIVLHEKSSLVGMALGECGVGRDLGVIIVGIKQATGETRFNPAIQSTLGSGDTLIALGEVSKLRDLEEVARGDKS